MPAAPASPEAQGRDPTGAAAAAAAASAAVPSSGASASSGGDAAVDPPRPSGRGGEVRRDAGVADHRPEGGPLLSYIWCDEEEEEEDGDGGDAEEEGGGEQDKNAGGDHDDRRRAAGEEKDENDGGSGNHNDGDSGSAKEVKDDGKKSKGAPLGRGKQRRVALRSRPSPKLEGQTLYLGGEVGSDGNVYFIPGHAPRVLKLTVAGGENTKGEADRAHLIGPDLLVSPTTNASQKFKWLRGIAVGDVIYGLPCHADCVLRIHVPTQAVTTLGVPYESFFAGGEELARRERHMEWKYHGGSVCPRNGCLYGIPQSALHVLKIDPRTERVSLVGPALPGRCKWYGGVVGRRDGAIYGIPHNSPSVLRILGAKDGSGEDDVVTLHGHFGDGGHKWHGAAADPSAAGVVVCVPANADTVLCIRPRAAAAAAPASCPERGESVAEGEAEGAARPGSPELFQLGGPGCVRTGRHRSDGKYKYLGALAGPDGLVYCFPSGSERVLQVDAARRAAREVGPNLRDRGMERLRQNKWQNGVCVTNRSERAVYAIPLAAESVLRIDCAHAAANGGEPAVTAWPLPEPRRGLAKWEGAVVAPNGVAYAVPNNHKAILRIESPGLGAAAAPVAPNGVPAMRESSPEEASTGEEGGKTQSTPNGSTEDSKSSPFSPPDEARGKHSDLPYASGIPTLRSSAHRVKCSPRGRSSSDRPRPRNRRGDETGAAWLPPELRAEAVLDFDARQHDLAGAVGRLLRKCDPSMVGSFEGPGERLESFRVPAASTWRAVNGGRCEAAQRYLSDRVAGDGEFLEAFDRFVKQAVLPHLKSRLAQLGLAADDPESVAFYYQRPPTLRLQPGPAWAQVKAHHDAEYGHQNGELNVWIPLTDREETGVDLWVESESMKGDFHPVPARPGQLILFHGSSCRHYVNPNASPRTRVSMDFRVGVEGYFDAEWEMRGTTDDHSRREARV